MQICMQTDGAKTYMTTVLRWCTKRAPALSLSESLRVERRGPPDPAATLLATRETSDGYSYLYTMLTLRNV